MDISARFKPEVEQFQFGPWCLTATKSHILKSEGLERKRFESELRLPQVPEMIFADNVLRLQHADGYGLVFNALEALKLVDPEHDLMKVAVAKEWKEAREDCEHINEVVKPYDWTYTTDYCGTLLGKENAHFKVTETTERIDMEKLKVREKIHFYSDLILYEDELADNGCSLLSVKIRVMPSSFFILMRFYLRVDSVLVRVNDTRIYHQCDKNYMIREYASKEKKICDLKVASHIITDPNEVGPHLDLVTQKIEKLEFPNTRESPISNEKLPDAT